MAEIVLVDPTDERTLRAWFDTWQAAQAHRPPDLLPSWEAARVPLETPRPDAEIQLVAVREDAALAGAAMLHLPLDDNRTVAYADLMVRPEHRCRGLGSLLLDELETRARAADRDRLLTEVFVAPGDDPADPHLAFAERRGYSVANREGVKAVDLTGAEPRWAALETEVEAVLGDYRVVTWADVCPDEYVASFGRALSRVMSLIPQGELDLEDREWTVERIREYEQHRIDVGLVTLETVALSADAEVVGLTGLRVSRADPRLARISVTMVLPEHRGHRLGLATKLAGHRALRDQVPGCRLVATSNSEVNTHMNAINEAMGYQLLETLVECHRQL